MNFVLTFEQWCLVVKYQKFNPFCNSSSGPGLGSWAEPPPLEHKSQEIKESRNWLWRQSGTGGVELHLSPIAPYELRVQSVFYSNRYAFKGTCHIYFHTGERRLWRTPEWRAVQKIPLLVIKITHKNWLILLFCFQEFEASIGNSSSAWQ